MNDFVSALVPAFGAILNFDFSSSDAKQLSSPSIAGSQRKRSTTGTMMFGVATRKSTMRHQFSCCLLT